MNLTALLNSIKNSFSENPNAFNGNAEEGIRFIIKFIESLQSNGFNESFELYNHSFTVDFGDCDLRLYVCDSDNNVIIDLENEDVYSFLEDILHVAAQFFMNKENSYGKMFFEKILITLYQGLLNVKAENFKERYGFK